MKMNSLFIPKKCKVGFNIRDDCFTKKLGYVIAFDGKKWRKENSWEGWRQKEGDSKGRSYSYEKKQYIDSDEKYGEEVRVLEFDNTPISGFVLNKKAGGGRSHWNTRRTVSRIYDPRGFEFEIGIENLLYILEHCNCMRGKGLEGEFIYSWDGKDLLLLPSESPEFQSAMNYTGLQSLKISAKDLVPGCSYKTKKEDNLIYVGRYMWYETDWHNDKGRKGKKCHIFWKEKEVKPDEEIGGDFVIKNDVSFLAVKNSDEPVSNFAKIIDKFNKNPRSSDIVKCDLISGVFSDKIINTNHYGPGLEKYIYFGRENDEIIEFSIQSENEYERVNNVPNYNKYISKGYSSNRLKSFNEKTKSVKYFDNYYYSSRATTDSYRSSGKKIYQLEDLKRFDFCDLYITLENGNKIQIKDLTEI